MKKHITFRCDTVVIEEAKTLSKRDNRSLSNLMETALIEYLKKHRK